MLYEFAITPDVFDGAMINSNPELGRILIQILRQLSINGMLADLHKGAWKKEVRERIGFSDSATGLKVERDVILQLLNRLDDFKRLVRHRRSSSKPMEDVDWLNIAFESHQEIPFDAIILGQKLLMTCKQNDPSLNDPALIELDTQVLNTRIWANLSSTQSITLTKSDSDYQKYLAPILRHAKMLHLVDPYIRFDSSRVIDICAKLMGKRSHDVLFGTIHIHTGNPNSESVATLYDTWTHRLQPLANRYKHTFNWYLWKKPRTEPERFHNRYILTDQCGIFSGDSFECMNYAPSSNDWALLNEERRKERLRDFDPENSPFKLLKDAEIKPS